MGRGSIAETYCHGLAVADLHHLFIFPFPLLMLVSYCKLHHVI